MAKEPVLGDGHEKDWTGVKDKKWDPNDAWDPPKDDDGKPPWQRGGGWDW